MTTLHLAAALACLLPSAAPEPPAVDKSELRVLLVAHDPENPSPAFAELRDGRSGELFAERKSAFEALLREHFTDVRVVLGEDYEVALSDTVDVTLFDSRPKALTPVVNEVDPATGERHYEPATYLPESFTRPALMIADVSPRIGEPLGLKLDWL